MHSNSLNNHLLNLHQGITFWWKHKTKWRSWPKQWQHFNQYPHPDRSQHEIEWNLTVCTQWISPQKLITKCVITPSFINSCSNRHISKKLNLANSISTDIFSSPLKSLCLIKVKLKMITFYFWRHSMFIAIKNHAI